VSREPSNPLIPTLVSMADELVHLHRILVAVLGVTTCVCAPVPLCVNKCKNVVHFCPDCGTKLATFHRSGNGTSVHAFT
jgi:hypothetical protein